MEARAEAHDAVARRDWTVAYERFLGLDRLTGDDHDALADCAHWLGRPDEVIAGFTSAYRLHLDEGRTRKAALSAFMLSVHQRIQGEGAQADGWLARAQRLLADDDDCVEAGYPLYLEVAALMGSDLEAAAEDARRMQALGRRFGDDTLVALGVFFEGRSLVKQARVREGLALLDEAMVAALADNLNPMWTGAIYCGLLDACHELADIRRAREWTEATQRWCDPLPLASLYPGICRVHRAELLDLRGSWAEAEAEALGACEDMARIDVFVVADGWYQVGEIRRRRGDLAGAEAAYTEANALGREPQPGLALLRLAEGRVDVATTSIATALSGFGGSPLERAPLGLAQAEIALAAGDTELARRAVAEVAEVAERFESTGLRAAAHRSRGAVALADGVAVEAVAALRLACTAWHELDAPYEVARTRVLLAAAYAALDDHDAAARERAAARECFARVGAIPELRALEEEPDAPPAGLTAREVEVLRQVATGASNREIADALFISEKTVARHLSNIFTKIGVASRSAATAFAFDHRLA